jgi:hypothetical protein
VAVASWRGVVLLPEQSDVAVADGEQLLVGFVAGAARGIVGVDGAVGADGEVERRKSWPRSRRSLRRSPRGALSASSRPARWLAAIAGIVRLPPLAGGALAVGPQLILELGGVSS